jgi:hypothetical protein
MTYWPVTKQEAWRPSGGILAPAGGRAGARAAVPGFRFGAVIEQHRLSARDGAPSAVVP